MVPSHPIDWFASRLAGILPQWLAALLLLIVPLCAWFIGLYKSAKPETTSVSPTQYLLYGAIASCVLYILAAISRIESKLQETSTLEYIDDAELVYRGFNKSLEQAQDRIRLTHVRHAPLNPYNSDSSKFQSGLDKWINKSENRRVQRIFANEAINHKNTLKYIDTHTSGKVACHCVPWAFDVPMINLAVFDSNVAFICFYSDCDSDGTGAPIHAIKVTDSHIVARLVAYFDSLWGATSPIDHNYRK